MLPSAGPYANAGYVSNIAESGYVRLELPAAHTAAIPGMTITWSSEYGEYPRVFTVTATNGSETVAELTVIDNNSNRSVVALNIANYDAVSVTVHNWCLPNHRTRIDSIKFGHDVTFTKQDIMSFTHEQFGSLVSGELPKNSIEFSINNADSLWNPSNPAGMGRYLSERQRLTVRYGLDIDGTTEWIDAGVFYLSEWRSPANGIDASFVARDIFEYLISITYTGRTSGTLAEIITDALSVAGVPAGFTYELDEKLSNTTATVDLAYGYTCAEVVQLCANMGVCMIYQDRAGKLHVKGLTSVEAIPVYTIPLSLSYSHPEIELSKPLKSVTVYYGEDTYIMTVGSSGEAQTVSNPLVTTQESAEEVASGVAYALESRKAVSGEYRADPRLDLFDCVAVETRFGYVSPVILTNIKYSFSGAFKASYTGHAVAAPASASSLLGEFVLGVSRLKTEVS